MKMEHAVFFVLSVLLMLFGPRSIFAAVGETYDSMVFTHGVPGQADISRVVKPGKVSRYKTADVKGYIFKIREFKVYALFNKNNICFEMFTLHNRTHPDPAMLIGHLAETTPEVLYQEPMRAIELQYGEGKNTVIYHSWGTLHDQSAEAYSEALEPK